MLFNSLGYIFLFLPIIFVLYFALLRIRKLAIAQLILIFGSLFFYGFWNPNYLILIFFSIGFNYTLGQVLNGKASFDLLSRKQLLVAGVIVNVLILGGFKYLDFLIDNVNWLFGSEVGLLKLVLPLAISFFTFQQIAYLVDSYKGKTSDYSLSNYILFVTFFPQLIAGPIVHHSEMMPQFENKKNHKIISSNIAKGLFIFILGLFKKVVVADTFAQWADSGFNATDVLSFYDAWGTSLSYTFQLYYDFSGYTDMAIGAALLFNIVLPINFNSPYKALNIQDFWRRWHMTLSRFLKDYIYIPLGGSKVAKIITYRNLMITFIIGGVWHGAGWTFILWGAMHGLALVIHSLWKQTNIKMHSVLAWLMTFLFVNFAWVFFKASSFDSAMLIVQGMVNFDSVIVSQDFATFFNYIFDTSYWELEGTAGAIFLTTIDTIGYLLLFGGVTILLPNSMELIQRLPYKGRWRFKPTFIYALFCAVLAALALATFIGNTVDSPFLYFNF